VSRRQPTPEESAKASVKNSRRLLRVFAARKLDSTDSELVGGNIDHDLLRKVDMVRQRVLGEQAKTDDPRSVFDWGL
jgi:hypothetical protein